MKTAYSLLALSAVVIASANIASADESPATPPTETATAAADQSPWGWVKMPKITMPKIEMPKMPADPLAPIKNSAKKVGEGASKAWEGTKEIFTLGGAKTAAAESPKTPEDKGPSLWQKMFGGAEKKEPEGPQTVAEFMAQKRLDP